MDICWRTKNNDHPGGKPRVYLSATGGDFKRYSEKIFKQLWNICDCAIYFYPAGAKVATDEDYYLNVSRMDLIVIPVTAELLCKPNRTMDFDVAFATDRNIPILPLIQESDLVELFNRRFGNVQFLQETPDDHTAIPYQEKLQTFLDAVLTNDALCDEIRSAFCARIFLSYRKKDRAHAQTLMSLIHADPKFRDVAIWYDEFLIPGDDFERNIHRELKGSDLFLLAVTPNVLEPDNYVMRTEYPAANNVLPVIPAELVPTDVDRLRACYPGISDPVDAYDNEKRSQLLEAVLCSKLQQDPQPYHQYLMGMAYFQGVDVEKDPQKGIALLTEAAREGVWEAAKKLADIYHLGDHVPRNYTEAKYWLTRLTAIAKAGFDDRSDKKATLEYYNALISAGSVCEQNLDDPAAIAYYEQAISVAQMLCGAYGYSQKLLADCYGNVARVYIGSDHYEKAIPYQLEAVKRMESLCKTTPTPEQSRALVNCFCELARCHQELGNLREAVEYFGKAVNLLQEMLKAQKVPDIIRELVELYDDLGDILKTLGEKRQKRLYEKEADRLFRVYRKELETGGEAAWMTAARYYMKRGNLRTAVKLMDKAVAVSQQRTEEDPSFANQMKLAAQYGMLGYIWDARNHRKHAEKYHRLTVQLLETLAAEYPNPQIQLDLVDAYAALGDACDRTLLYDEPDDILYSDYYLPKKDRPAVEEAYGYYTQALQLFNQVDPPQGQAEIKQKMELLDNLGRLSKALGLRGEATLYYRQYGTLSCDLCEQNDSDIHRDLYAGACFKLALLTRDADLMIEARDCWQALAAAYPGNRTYVKKRNEAQRLLDA
jgi:tetratricopeptide (TPR) repeat protein